MVCSFIENNFDKIAPISVHRIIFLILNYSKLIFCFEMEVNSHRWMKGRGNVWKSKSIVCLALYQDLLWSYIQPARCGFRGSKRNHWSVTEIPEMDPQIWLIWSYWDYQVICWEKYGEIAILKNTNRRMNLYLTLESYLKKSVKLKMHCPLS